MSPILPSQLIRIADISAQIPMPMLDVLVDTITATVNP
jgi:hypothetical protein